MLTAFIVVVDLLLMADGKCPRDEGSSGPPHGPPRVCRELFWGRYFRRRPRSSFAVFYFAMFMVIPARW